jgi:hypothetical protein
MNISTSEVCHFPMSFPLHRGRLRHRQSRPWCMVQCPMGSHTRWACNLSSMRWCWAPNAFRCNRNNVFTAPIQIIKHLTYTHNPPHFSEPWGPTLITYLGSHNILNCLCHLNSMLIFLSSHFPFLLYSLQCQATFLLSGCHMYKTVLDYFLFSWNGQIALLLISVVMSEDLNFPCVLPHLLFCLFSFQQPTGDVTLPIRPMSMLQCCLLLLVWNDFHTEWLFVWCHILLVFH